MDNYIYSIRTLLFAIGMLLTTLIGSGPAQDARQSVIEQGEQGTIGSVPKSKVDDPPVINRLPQDLTVHNQPLVTRSEAFAGRPLGIGNVSFRLRAGDEMIIRTGSAMIREADGRIFYPVMTKSPVTKFFQTLAGVRPAQPDNVHTIWFLFSGDQPLKLSLLGSGIVEQVIPVKVARERQFDRHLTKWWGEFNDAANRQMEWGDYPALIETYLTSMLSRRLALPPPRKVQKSKDPLSETLDLLFDVESIRTDAIQRSVSGLADNGTADLPLPASIQWTPGSVSNLPADIEIEAIAKCVPEECFYLRFGTWQNQIWLKRLMEEYGGDLGRMVSLRGYKPTIDSKFLDQLAIESSELDQMFGGNLVSDVVVIGTDMYFGEGSSVGVLLRAKNTVSLRNNLMSKRTRFAQKNKDLGVELNEVQHKGTTIHVMATADNRYRSFYATVGDNHLTTTSLTMARRFIEAAGGDRSLGDSDEFKFARYHMPLKRDDTVFVYLSTPFFQSLLEPAYQIELRRRNRIVADMQLYEMARLAARAEGYDPDRMDQLVQNGFLPARFDRRPDQSRFETGQDAWQDNTRGRRGFFTPIPDIKINAVSRDEADWYAARSASFAKNAATIEPLMFAIKRFQSETDKNVERVVFDAHVPPFGMEKYDWLISMIGPPLKQKVKTIPNELISVQVSMVGDQSNPDIEPHLIFVGVQDEIDFPVDLQPTSSLQLLDTIRTTPGYLGAYPKLGYLDWMRNLGGVPDAEGFTYSRLLKIWRMQLGDFSVLAFDQDRLRKIKPHLEIVPAEAAAQVRIQVGDLKNSGLNNWADSMNYRRAWQTSIANIKLLNMLIDQFDVPAEQAKQIAERMLNVRLVCSLGGEYQVVEMPSGRKLWHSTAWPSFSQPAMPGHYSAPVLEWFRGTEIEISQIDNQFVVHGILDIERKMDNSSLPPFRLFQGFGNLFTSDKKSDDK